MIEKMADFFDSRIDGYEDHMLDCIEGAREFYPYTAALLPTKAGANVLDLGCGTGLELVEYFKINTEARVTGIDLAPGMLGRLCEKFQNMDLTLIQGSYFDVDLGSSVYDAAVSVESIHHFTKQEKVSLYSNLHRALRDGGYFILTDYFADKDETEIYFREEYFKLRKEQGIADTDFYHYDTPLTVEHETEALIEAGFSSVLVMKSWAATYTLKAIK
jgi:tRNA (cmo5U34)-methyltransferase